MAFVDISPPIYVSIPKNNGMTVEMPRHPGAVVPIPSGAQGLPGEPGFSPVVSVEEITGGHRITITDEEGDNTFDVMNGAQGAQGEPGEGVPTGGVTGQVLKKRSNADYDTEWADESGTVLSVNGQTGAVVLDADDVGALPDDTFIPTKTSDLTNDSGFVNATQAAAAAPVQSVNGQTGNVSAIPSGGTEGQILMKSSSTDYADEWAYISEAGAMSKWELLWTNASPTSAFAAQTIALDLSGYDAVAIEAVNIASYSETDANHRRITRMFLGVIGRNIGMSLQLRNNDSILYNYLRYAETSSTGIAFGGGVTSYGGSSSGGASNDACVPLRIYGIKGVG